MIQHLAPRAVSGNLTLHQNHSTHITAHKTFQLCRSSTVYLLVVQRNAHMNPNINWLQLHVNASIIQMHMCYSDLCF